MIKNAPLDPNIDNAPVDPIIDLVWEVEDFSEIEPMCDDPGGGCGGGGCALCALLCNCV